MEEKKNIQAEKPIDDQGQSQLQGNNHKQRMTLLIVSIIFAAVFFTAFYFAYNAFIKQRRFEAGKKPEKTIAEEKAVENGQDEIKSGEALDFGNIKIEKPTFAAYKESGVLVAPSLKSEKIKVSDLSNWKSFIKEEWKFSDAQIQALEDKGFFLADNDYIKDQTSGNDDFADTYLKFTGQTNMYYRKPQDTLFISSDAALHFFHILVDRSFQKIEEDKFQPIIKEMSRLLFLRLVPQ